MGFLEKLFKFFFRVAKNNVAEKFKGSMENVQPPAQEILDKELEQIKIKDERKAECPNCHKILPKIPGAKTKCQYCGEFMFVRTRPNHVRLVVSKDEADKIDEEWSAINETFNNDVDKISLNRQLATHSVNGDWGLYRNDRSSLAGILAKEMRTEASLQTYLEVCYLDLNEPNNLGGIDNPELLKKHPPFSPNFDSLSSSLAPGILDLVRRITLKLNLSKNRIKQIFIEHNTVVEKNLRLPLSAEKAWQVLEKEL
ncbi:MAG: hypothetical protein PHO56_02245 [Patescibacteria group bacterium]|nr:hypothetical protein [Patescibacteria group bacterium]